MYRTSLVWLWYDFTLVNIIFGRSIIGLRCLQGLQSAFGYEPYPGFEARVKAKVDADIKAWKDKKQKKIS